MERSSTLSESLAILKNFAPQLEDDLLRDLLLQSGSVEATIQYMINRQITSTSLIDQIDRSRDVIDLTEDELMEIDDQKEDEEYSSQQILSHSHVPTNSNGIPLELVDSVTKGWTKRMDDSPMYWPIFIRHLLEEKKMSTQIARDILFNARIMLHKLGDPKELQYRSGLVFGEVQSGKTTSMQALLSLALDLGYKFIIVLSGRKKVLRKQTQDRFSAIFNLVTTDEHPVVNWLTSPSKTEGNNTIEDEDIGGKHIHDRVNNLRPKLPVVVVIKKTPSSLEWLCSLLGCPSDYQKTTKKQNLLMGRCSAYRNFPALIIDDECDDASINYSYKSKSKIYQLISYLRTTFDKGCHYIGYTATPQPNLLSDPKDLLFPDFVWSLTTSSGAYLGLDLFKDNRYEDVVKIVPYDDWPNYGNDGKIYPGGQSRGLKDKQEEALNKPASSSVYQALFDFVYTGAIRKWRAKNSVVRTSTGTPQLAVIENMQSMPLETFRTCLHPPHNSLFHLVKSQIDPQVKSNVRNAFAVMIDQGKINYLACGISMSEVFKLDSLLEDTTFLTSKFVCSGDPTTDKWNTLLSVAVDKQIIVYTIDANSSAYQIGQEAYYGDQLVNRGKLHIFYDRKTKQYHEIVKIADVLPSPTAIPHTPISPLFNPTPEKKTTATPRKPDPLWHAALFHFSSFHAINIPVYSIVDTAWKYVQNHFRKLLAPSPDYASISKTLTNIMKKSWNSILKKLEKSNMEIPDQRYLTTYIHEIVEKTKIKLVINGQSNFPILRTFDYDTKVAEDQKCPEYLICIGGDILGRGITIQGLTVSYYVRASKNDSMDTCLQHCRWFGWHHGYEDLITVYFQDRHLQLFQDIAQSDQKLREEFKKAAISGADPRTTPLLLRKFNSFHLTSPMKRRNQIAISAGVFYYCNQPNLKNRIVGLKALENVYNLFKDLNQSTTNKCTKSTAHVFYYVDITKLLNTLDLLKEYNPPIFHLMNRISFLMESNNNVTFNVAFRRDRNSAPSDRPLIDHPLVKTFGLTKRGRLGSIDDPRGRAHFKLWAKKSNTNKLEEDEFLDATQLDDQLTVPEKILHWYSMEDSYPIARTPRAPVLLVFYVLDPWFEGRVTKKHLPEELKLPKELKPDYPLIGLIGVFSSTFHNPVPMYNILLDDPKI